MKALFFGIVGLALGVVALTAGIGSFVMTFWSIYYFWTLHWVLSFQYMLADAMLFGVAGLAFAFASASFDAARE